MSSPESTPSPVATPTVRHSSRLNLVWLVPILALMIGGWMIYRNFTSQGPVAEVSFDTADGLVGGKTDVRCRSVRVGVVKDVQLAEDLNSVVIQIELEPENEHLLTKGTSFWVVRPRVSPTNITGLGTLITGAYVELDPGPREGAQVNKFKGFESPPSTNPSIPGRRIVLKTDQAGSLAAGSPLYFRGIEVGRIESRKLEAMGLEISYDVFVQEEYANLVKTNSRFWNNSGIDITAGANGLEVKTPSLVALVSGGATFGVTEGTEAGPPAVDGQEFQLFENEEAANGASFNTTMQFILLFDQSIRGLAKGAPLEYRGIAVGRVVDISFKYLNGADETRIPAPIPVLVELDPSLMRRDPTRVGTQVGTEFLEQSVKRGLRASLKIASLLTGALYVDLDYWKSSPSQEITRKGEFTFLPTETSAFAQIESDIPLLMEKIDTFILEATTTAKDSRNTMLSFQDTMTSIRKTLDSEEFLKLPADVRGSLAAFEKTAKSLDLTVKGIGPESPAYGDLLRTLDEVRASVRSMSALTTSLDDKPNSLIFGRDSSKDFSPKAPK